jgi:hypothetical protein
MASTAKTLFWVFIIIGALLAIFAPKNPLLLSNPFSVGEAVGRIITILLIPTIIYFFNKKEFKKSSKPEEYNAEYALLGLFVFTIIFLFIPITGTNINTSYYDNECNPPYYEVGLRCCKPSDSIIGLCEDEEMDFTKKLEMETVTKNNTLLTNTIPYFEFNTPEGYILIKDMSFGGVTTPYMLIATNELGEGVIEIKVVTSYIEEEYRIDAINSFIEGVSEIQELDFTLISSEDTTINNIKMKELTFYENTNYNPIIIKYNIFTNKSDEYIITFILSITEEYSEYISEYDSMIKTIREN